jgi:hypothetical protein
MTAKAGTASKTTIKFLIVAALMLAASAASAQPFSPQTTQSDSVQKEAWLLVHSSSTGIIIGPRFANEAACKSFGKALVKATSAPGVVCLKATDLIGR